MLVERKTITRNYYENPSCEKLIENGKFICVGQWANGYFAYSRIDENGNEIEEESGMYYQIRENGKLVMIHC